MEYCMMWLETQYKNKNSGSFATHLLLILYNLNRHQNNMDLIFSFRDSNKSSDVMKTTYPFQLNNQGLVRVSHHVSSHLI